ncbi:GIY-YIG nuclease family protein [Gordonia sp. DT219]|uniref:GIY-YIG nuclease family protein n=1 Tax=Gordonia sp. DT219 TaxID=3416658 RepID=UPI003CF64F62
MHFADEATTTTELTPLLADMIADATWAFVLAGVDHTAWIEQAGDGLEVCVESRDGLERLCRFDGHQWSELADEGPATRAAAESSEDSALSPAFLSPRPYRVDSLKPTDHVILSAADEEGYYAELFQMHQPVLVFVQTLLATGWRVRVTYSIPPAHDGRAEILLRADPPRSDHLYDKPIQRALGTVPGPPVAVALWTEAEPDSWDFDPNSTGFLTKASTIMERSPETLTDYALAVAPTWTLAAGVDEVVGVGSQPVRPSIVFTPPPPPTEAELAARQKAIRKWAADHDFSHEVRPATPKSVKAFLDLEGQGSAGYYLLEFHDGQCYVGQSIRIDQRLAQHLLNHPDTASIRIKADPAATNAPDVLRHLLHEESRLIHSAQWAGLHARTKSQMTVIVGTAALDEMLSTNEQADWLAKPLAGNADDLRYGRKLELTSTAFAGSEKNFNNVARLLGDERHHAFRLLERYLSHCVPLPNATEVHYWNISPPMNAYRGDPSARWRTLWCLSVGFVETFVILKELQTGDISGFVQVNGTELYGDTDPETAYIRMKRQHPGCEIRAAEYRDSGPDNFLIDFPNLKVLNRLLSDSHVTRAAATAALLLMRVRHAPKTRQQTHCPELVSAAWACR